MATASSNIAPIQHGAAEAWTMDAAEPDLHRRLERATAKGQSTNFIDPDQIPKTMADQHRLLRRDFLQPLGCDHWKINMGARPCR